MMDWDVSDDDIFNSTMDAEEDVLNTASLAMHGNALSSNSVVSTKTDEICSDIVIKHSNFTTLELGDGIPNQFSENDFEYPLPKSFHGNIVGIALIPHLPLSQKKLEMDLVLSLNCGDFVALKCGVLSARCPVGFAATSINVYPVLKSENIDLLFVLSNDGEVAIIKLFINEFKIIKKYSDVIKYDTISENSEHGILYKLKIQFKNNSNIEEFELYGSKIANESSSNDEIFAYLNHDLKFCQDLFREKQKMLADQIELKKEVFDNLLKEVSYSSSQKLLPLSKMEVPVAFKNHWFYIYNQKIIIGISAYNNTSNSINDFDLMVADLSTTSSTVRYRTIIYSKYIPKMTQSMQEEAYDVFLGPYQVNGMEWCRSSAIMPGENVILAILDPPKLDLSLHNTTLHSVLHYTVNEESLQTAVIDICINAKQIFGNELVPKFMDEKLSSQEIFSALASSGRVVELSIIPSSKVVITDITEALKNEMKFRSVENQSQGWLINVDDPMMFQHGILMRLAFTDYGQTKCIVAARNDEQLLLLIQSLYMNLPCGFAIISERTRIIQNELNDIDKKIVAEKSLESELLIIKQIMEERGEKCPDNLDKCFIRCDSNYDRLLHQLIDQEDITDKLMTQLEI